MKYHKLKCKMFELGISQRELAEKMNVGIAYISRRFTDKTPWELETVYAICKILEIPYTEIWSYWPVNG